MLRVRILATVTALLLKINIQVKIRFSKTEDALGMHGTRCLFETGVLFINGIYKND